jgi:plasmid stabilization system protein ParE
VTLLLGGRGYLFDERAAAHVVERIRAVFSAGSEHPHAARAGLLAELITEDPKAPRRRRSRMSSVATMSQS